MIQGAKARDELSCSHKLFLAHINLICKADLLVVGCLKIGLELCNFVENLLKRVLLPDEILHLHH